MTTLQFVPFDIETTGFEVTDRVTVVGFVLPMGCRVFVNTGGRAAPDVEATVAEQVDEYVNLSTHNAERTMLEAVDGFVAERLRGDDVLLVAYNGGLYNGGFDLPFLRTRHATLGVEWPFRELPYADLMPVVTNRFNTTMGGEPQSDLVGAYDVLVGGEYGDLDPFAESVEAVAAFEDAQFAELVLHCVADILRTDALGDLAQRYCSKSDFQLKSLTPTIHA